MDIIDIRSFWEHCEGSLSQIVAGKMVVYDLSGLSCRREEGGSGGGDFLLPKLF